MPSSTSTSALISIINIRGHLKRRVFRALKTFEPRGATCDELEHYLELKHQTLSARVRELYLGGWIRKVEDTRRTSSGRQATVYRVRRTRTQRKPRDRCDACGQVVAK